MNVTSSNLHIHVEPSEFEASVLEESLRRPVVTHFWAPWCGPCLRLGPLLESLALEADGAWLLASVDTDHASGLAALWNVRCLPHVKAFRDRKAVAEFSGSLPPSRVRGWIEALLPGGLDALLARAATEEEKGALKDAAAIYASVLARSPRHPDALLGVARILVTEGRLSEAESALEMISVEERHRLRGPLARLRFLMRAAETGGVAEAELRLQERKDASSRFALGTALTAEGRYEEALGSFLDAIRQDARQFTEPGRRAMLLVFDILGERSPLAHHYRSLLAMEIYRR
jgi:putative thioredoxin